MVEEAWAFVHGSMLQAQKVHLGVREYVIYNTTIHDPSPNI